MTTRSAVLPLFILLAGVPGSVDAQSRARGQVPSVVARVLPHSFSTDTDGITFGILVEVPPNHHGYLDRGDDGFLIPFTFSFPTMEEAGVRIEAVSRPTGVRDIDFRAQVLRGRAEFWFRLVPAPAVPSKTSASLRYQICDDRTSRCYPPKVVRIPITGFTDNRGDRARISLPLHVDIGDGTARQWMQSGWHENEAAGGASYAWSDGMQSVLTLPLPTGGDIRMDFEVLPFVFPGSPRQRVSIVLNGRVIKEVSLRPGLQKYSVILPGEALLDSRHTLEFRYAYARAPRDVIPNAQDLRTLAVAWYSVDFSAVNPRGGTDPGATATAR